MSAWDHYIFAPDPNPASSVAAAEHAAPVPENPPDPVEKLSAALVRMSQVDPSVLELAETHPVIAKALIDAAMKDSQG